MDFGEAGHANGRVAPSPISSASVSRVQPKGRSRLSPALQSSSQYLSASKRSNCSESSGRATRSVQTWRSCSQYSQNRLPAAILGLWPFPCSSQILLLKNHKRMGRKREYDQKRDCPFLPRLPLSVSCMPFFFSQWNLPPWLLYPFFSRRSGTEAQGHGDGNQGSNCIEQSQEICCERSLCWGKEMQSPPPQPPRVSRPQDRG